MNNKRAFTLVEILVVVAIIILMAALMMPSIKAMQSGSARANALNIINAALQGVRSYAIMNNCKTAARFQPNGKIVFVYRFTNTQNTAEALRLGGGALAAVTNSYPQPGFPNAEGYIYLPVLDQEPLHLPNGYAASRLAYVNTAAANGEAGLSPTFYEPFYICYNPDGTLAAGEPIWVAMVLNATHPEPVNPDFKGPDPTTGLRNYSWSATSSDLPKSYTLSSWLKFTQGETEVTSIGSIDNHKLTCYYYIAEQDDELPTIFANEDIGIDHYAGRTSDDNTSSNVQYPSTFETNSVSSFALFKTPDNWKSLPLYRADRNVTLTKASFINKNFYTDHKQTTPLNTDLYETIHINPYTGRLIRPVE